MRLALALCLLAGCGAKKSAEQAPPVRSGEEADKLWALAPPGTIAGGVITPHGMAELDRGFERVRKIIAASPELAPARGELDAAIAKVLGTSQGHLADAGIATDRGFAMFVLANQDAIVIAPVTDRAKFVAAMHGTSHGDADRISDLTCMTVSAGYACAKDQTLLASLGKAPLTGQLAAAGARGDVELYVGPRVLGHGLTELFVTVALDDGVLDAHGFLAGKLPSPIAALADLQGLAPDANGGGFVLANFAPGLAEIPASSPAGKLARALKGPVEATMSATELGFQARVPLVDPAPWQALLDHCDQLSALIHMPVTAVNGACRITLEHALVPAAFDAWIEDGELRLGNRKGASSGHDGETRTAVGRELATGTWPVALWGRGTIFAVDLATVLDKRLDPKLLPQLPMVLRILAQLDELGIGARVAADGAHFRAYGRTIWSNPADVAEQLAAIAPAELVSGKSKQLAADIATKHPDSPFAVDLAAGPNGLMMPIGSIGILAAIAIPAFMDYMKKSKVSEAALMLNRLGKNAKVAYIANAEFPKGMATLTPPTSCCAGPQGKCVGDWTQPVWQALDFQIDRPSLFQYSYASDGTAFNATAVGDLDCDGTMITYTLSGTAEQGNVKLQLTEPAPNSD